MSPKIVVAGAHDWIETNGRQSREFIEKLLGPGRRRNDQRSRIILALAKWEKTTFYATDINEKLKELFPVSLKNRRVQVTRALNKLASGDARLLKFDEETGRYRIATPKLRSVLRHVVYQDPADESALIREDNIPEANRLDSMGH